MPMTSVEIREERATIISEARKSWTEAETREGGPTAEDKQSFDKAMDGADELLERATRLERLERATGDLDESRGRVSDPLEPSASTGETDPKQDEARKREAFRYFLQTGEIRRDLQHEHRRAIGIMSESRDTIISTDSKGGFLITPTQISNDIVKAIRNEVFIRRLCEAAGSVTTVKEAKKLGIRKMATAMSDANWTTEVAAVTEDTTMAFARRDLEPFLCSKLAKVSIRTLMLSTEAENEVTGELGYKFGVTEEKAFIAGDGSGKPLGVYTASADGVSTARDITASATTSFTGDDLINMKFSLKAGYMRDPSTAWVLHRDAVKMARKLKVASSTGGNDQEYAWQPGLTEGEPDRILDIPYYMSEYAPNTFTPGLYAAVLGCFRFYRIAQLADTVIQRLVELYAATNEVGFIGRRWVDGAPVLEEAFARLKLAAS